MGLLDMIMGMDNALDNQDIASDMLKDSKFAVISLARAVTEVVNPQIKQMLTNQLLTCVAQHHQLSDLVTSKDWYQPFLPPQKQIQHDLNLADNLHS